MCVHLPEMSVRTQAIHIRQEIPRVAHLCVLNLLHEQHDYQTVTGLVSGAENIKFI